MKTYTIKEVSEMFDFPASTLRYYEETGLLPEVKRTHSGQRIYTDEHLCRLGAICCFKRTGMSIAQLKDFFKYEQNESEHIDDMLSLLKDQKKSVENQIKHRKEDYEHLKHKLNYYGDIKKSLQMGLPHPDWNDYE